MGKPGKQKWNTGDQFLIPLEDGSFGVGQVIACSPLTLKNAAICAFFDQRFATENEKFELELDAKPYAVLWVTIDLLDAGVWQVFGNSNALDPRTYYPDIDERRARGFVGTKVYGSGIARKLVNAFFGLLPWDAFAEPDYLDGLLLSPDMRPARAVFTK